MSKHALAVTTDAILDDDRRRVVKLVTVETIESCMRRDRRRVGLRIRMTGQARGRFRIRRERVTRHAIGLQRGIALMRVRGLFLMAARARTTTGIFETFFFVVVTFLAREPELLDMLLVTRAGARDLPRRWNQSRRNGDDAMRSPK
jgi:hypothetical protein